MALGPAGPASRAPAAVKIVLDQRLAPGPKVRCRGADVQAFGELDRLTWSWPSWAAGLGVRSEEERELVREAASRVLEGDGVMTIAGTGTVEACPGV